MSAPASAAWPPPPATTVDHLEHHACAQPGKLALSIDGQDIPYRRLFEDVMRVTAALHAQGLGAPGSTAAVGHADLYQHWLLLLACENLGVATASFARTEWQALPALLGAVDVVLTDGPLAGAPAATHALDADWFGRALQMPWATAEQAPRLRGEPQATQRITRSSGSTQAPKMMRLARYACTLAVQRLADTLALSPQAVLLLAGPFAVNSTYAAATACLQRGATVVRGPLVPTLRQRPITHLRCLTGTLAQLLQHWPADAPRLADLRIATGGGPLPAALRQRALQVLCGAVGNSYGTNESGGICPLDGDNTGVLAAGVDLRIVDDTGQELPLGEVGHIAVRSPSLVDGYWGDPALTERHFRGGWFYPGDTGRLLSPRRLALLGRDDDMLNLGGIKKSPTVIEDLFLAHPMVQAAAAAALTQADGSQALLVGVVLRDRAALTEVAQVIQRQLPPWAATLRLLALDALPTTPNGKVQRQALKALVTGAAAP
jgi:acyl-CoA synthetase (AMP-forming)/AMP-acid ligase II